MRTHPLVAALGTLCAAYFALWACAPVAMVRPPVPMGPDDQGEFGVAGAWNTGLNEYDLASPTVTANGPSGQLWYAHHFGGDHFVLGGVAFGGSSSLVGAGAQLRYNAVQGSNFRLGIDVESGFLWAAVGVPMAWRLGEGAWLYTAPSAGVRLAQALRLPLGLSINAGDHVLLTPEISLGYGTAANGLFTSTGGLQVSAALGSTFRF